MRTTFKQLITASNLEGMTGMTFELNSEYKQMIYWPKDSDKQLNDSNIKIVLHWSQIYWN